MARTRPGSESSRLLTLIAIVVIVAVLYFAKAVLIPLALAVLLTFLLAPLVNRLQRLGLGRVTAVCVVVAMSFVFIGALAYVVAGQVVDLAARLPQYKDNIRAKVEALRLPQDGIFNRASKGLQEISEEVLRDADTQPAEDGQVAAGDDSLSPPVAPVSGQTAPAEPVPVEIYQREPNAVEYLSTAIGPLLQPLASAGIVIVFVIFMLLKREDLRDRVIRLIGEGRLTATTEALDEAASRVSRFLVAQLIVNVTYGIPVAVGLYFIGVPNWLIWGVLATLLRFVPYVGPWVAAALPIVLSLAVFDTWTQPLATIGLFVALELISNNIIEPWLYGSKTGISAVAVLVSAVFWAWLWGGVGLILATPLTVCLVVMGRHVPQLEFLSVLLGDQPSLSPEARLYQRLLALDQEEAMELAQEYLKDHDLENLYEAVFLHALRLAESDRHRGMLDADRLHHVQQGLRELIEELGEQQQRLLAQKAAQETARAQAAASTSPPAALTMPVSTVKPPACDPRPCVLMLPAEDVSDELAGMMLAQLLSLHGASAETIGVDSLAGEMVERVRVRAPVAVCVSAMPPMAIAHSRYLCKRLSAEYPELKMVVGLWLASNIKHAQERIKNCGAERVVTTFAEAIAILREQILLAQAA